MVNCEKKSAFPTIYSYCLENPLYLFFSIQGNGFPSSNIKTCKFIALELQE